MLWAERSRCSSYLLLPVICGDWTTEGLTFEYDILSRNRLQHACLHPLFSSSATTGKAGDYLKLQVRLLMARPGLKIKALRLS
ncbi:hypothetical protein FA15DRAFT_160448 [Coprinopsis marcescibilis]|uniref:Uncharacterized protein n=1 Tax=Coprinopsis marcescibilis TaxID=230819 RepID=A0A5C3L632_COPMA|nr:hypothetical protein FA15DRAFT_160448 [Coprinopsis marcescibilis]